MPQGHPALLFPDIEAWAITYLTTALAARPEPYTSGVKVRNRVPAETAVDPWPTSKRLVVVRDDGGPRGDLTRTVSLGVRIWGATLAETSDLARLVAALLDNSPGSGRVVGVDGSSGPYPVTEESERPARYLSVDLVVTGASLT